MPGQKNTSSVLKKSRIDKMFGCQLIFFCNSYYNKKIEWLVSGTSSTSEQDSRIEPKFGLMAIKGDIML